MRAGTSMAAVVTSSISCHAMPCCTHTCPAPVTMPCTPAITPHNSGQPWGMPQASSTHITSKRTVSKRLARPCPRRHSRHAKDLPLRPLAPRQCSRDPVEPSSEQAATGRTAGKVAGRHAGRQGVSLLLQLAICVCVEHKRLGAVWGKGVQDG